jgi:flagellar basal-body rod modification protein FlgD
MYSPVIVNNSAALPQEAAVTSSRTSAPGGIDTMFMQLLITQLQNQDPLSPMDASTFVNQLVGVNTLDQVTQINQLLQNSASTSMGSSDNPQASTATAGGH